MTAAAPRDMFIWQITELSGLRNLKSLVWSTLYFPSCWIAGRRHACLGGSIQNHKNKDSLYIIKSLESGRIGQIVCKYRAFPIVRSIDFIIQCTISKSFIPQVDRNASIRGTNITDLEFVPAVGAEGRRKSNVKGGILSDGGIVNHVVDHFLIYIRVPTP